MKIDDEKSYMRRWKRGTCFCSLVVFAFCSLAIGRSQACIPEIEPNETPLQATPFTGTGCLTGTISLGDQDLFVWTLGPQDIGGKALAFDFESVPGVLSTAFLVHLELTDTGEATKNESLFRLSTTDGARVSREYGKLEPGTYYFGVMTASPSEGSYTLTVNLVEPTNVQAEALQLDDNLAAKGTFEGGRAVYGFTTSEPQLFRVQALGSGLKSLAYFDADGIKAQETRGVPPLRLDNLALPAGKHYFLLSGQDDYVLKVISLGPVPSGMALVGTGDPATEAPPQLTWPTGAGPAATEAASSANATPASPCVSEVEPNDNSDTATSLAKLSCVLGHMSADDSSNDFFNFEVDETWAQQRFDLEFAFSGDSDVTVYLQDDAGNDLQHRYFVHEGTLPDLVLKPGRYTLMLTASDDADLTYQVNFVQRGSPEAGFEQEPNDTPITASPMGSDDSVKGHFVGDERDTFKVDVTGEPQLWRLQATGQGLSAIKYYDGSGREIASRTTYDSDSLSFSNIVLLPGTNYISVEGVDGAYTLWAIPLGPPDAEDPTRPAGKAERESNDDNSRAERMRFGETRVGLVAEDDDRDLYRFTLYAPESVVVEATPGEAGGLRVRLDNIAEEYGEPDKTVRLETTLLPGDHYLLIQANTTSEKYYQVRLTRSLPGLSADLAMTLVTTTPTLSAYWYQGQTVDATLTVENRSTSAKHLALSATTSHYAWRASVEQSSMDLAANEKQTVPVRLTVLPDARDDQPVRVTVRAQDGSSVSEATLDLNAVCAAPAVGPSSIWPLPDELLGGLNVGWVGLGGRLAQEVVRGEDAIIDGIVSPSTGWITSPGGEVAVELASSTRLAGVLLNPQGPRETQYQLKDFEVLVSNDGASYTSVLTAELGAALTEQSFLFAEPVQAKFVALKAINNQAESDSDISLGEFKVVAAKEAGRSLNIADPAVGGYLVRSSPLRSNAYDVLSEEKEHDDRLDLEDGQSSMDWVIGFQDDRAAQITELQWEAGNDDTATLLQDVDVSVSLESPIGPWESLGTWQLAQAFKLAAPTWARFVRLSAANLDPEVSYRVADTVRVLERPTDEEYRSIIGEWGQNSRAAIYEYLLPPAEAQGLRETDDNDTRATAQTLASGVALAGQVTINEDVDWYKITVPPGDNTLELTIEGDPALRAAFELQDAQGKAVDLEQNGPASRVGLVATVTPGDYYLKLEEPPRSVIFTWDNSGSMGNYLDVIYQAISSFVQDVEVGREVVELQPFTDFEDGKFLLEDWSGDPYELMRSLNNYDRSDSSSSAETNLWAATKALGKRAGTRAVIIMTDAETSSYDKTPQLWESLEAVQPKVFTLETSTAGSSYTQDLMQSWADVAGGYYDYARTTGDFDIGFARATCLLRRPASYEVRVATRNQAPPGPGQLRVTRPADVATAPAVEIILDASGSMDKELGAETRIAVAKRVLSELVTTVLPEGTPFALRVFGHLEPMSCRTDLEVPLGPLEPAAVQAIVASVEPKLLSGTPIADSLNQVATDLQGAAGAKTIVLLTDGEESCGGDVEGAIRTLRAQGIAFQLNIVSFADAEEAAKEQFRKWAALGGGVYLEGGNDEELESAVTQALNPSFEVVDANGTVIGHGVVGGPALTVPAGVYTVRVATGEAFVNVRVRGEDDLLLSLGTTP